MGSHGDSGEDGFRRRESWRIAEGVHEFLPSGLAGEDLDMDPEVEGWDRVAQVGLRETDCVLFGGEERMKTAIGAALGEALDLVVGEAVMIRETFTDIDGGAELLELFLKTFGARDAGQCADQFAL